MSDLRLERYVLRNENACAHEKHAKCEPRASWYGVTCVGLWHTRAIKLINWLTHIKRAYVTRRESVPFDRDADRITRTDQDALKTYQRCNLRCIRDRSLKTQVFLTVASQTLSKQSVEHRAAVIAEGRRHESVRAESMRHVYLETLPQVLQWNGWII